MAPDGVKDLVGLDPFEWPVLDNAPHCIPECGRLEPSPREFKDGFTDGRPWGRGDYVVQRTIYLLYP